MNAIFQRGLSRLKKNQLLNDVNLQLKNPPDIPRRLFHLLGMNII